MNEPTDTTAFADTMRLVIMAPTDPTSPAPNPNLNPWLILRRDHLPLAFDRLHGKLHPSHREARQAFEAVLTELGTPFPKPAPFIALRMNTAQDGLPHAIGLRESLDWVAAETVAEALHTASLDDVPPEVIHMSCAWALPQLFETVKLSVRTQMEDAAADAIRDAGLTPRPTLTQILAERRKIFEGTSFAPLPPAEHQVILDLITAATPKARQYGLNPYQLFCDGRIGRLIPQTKALFAFEQLPPARQKHARSWIASALGWASLYAEPGEAYPDFGPQAGGKESL